jgi:uncharacterized tellurite resistance protein B-like protein
MSKPFGLSPALLNSARAFAHVSFSDGKIVQSEIKRFAKVVSQEPSIASEAPEAIAAAWEEAVREVEHAHSFGGPLLSIRTGMIDPEQKALMMRIAQVAVVADRKLEDQESGAIRMLADALGLDPDAY